MPSAPLLLLQAAPAEFTGFKAASAFVGAPKAADFHGAVSARTSVAVSALLLTRRLPVPAPLPMGLCFLALLAAPTAPAPTTQKLNWQQQPPSSMPAPTMALWPPPPPLQVGSGSRQVTVCAKKLRVAINGFGRIGRQFLRCVEGRTNSNLEIVAVNDSGGVKQASHLLKYDSTMGTFDADVKASVCVRLHTRLLPECVCGWAAWRLPGEAGAAAGPCPSRPAPQSTSAQPRQRPARQPPGRPAPSPPDDLHRSWMTPTSPSTARPLRWSPAATRCSCPGRCASAARPLLCAAPSARPPCSAVLAHQAVDMTHAAFPPPPSPPPQAMDIDLVIEGTGVFIDQKGASKHIEAGAKKASAACPPPCHTPEPFCAATRVTDAPHPNLTPWPRRC